MHLLVPLPSCPQRILIRLLSDKPEGRTSVAHLSLMDLCQASGHIYTDLSLAE